MQQDNQVKDFSLLRPFNAEAAKRGEAICGAFGDEPWNYVDGPDSQGNLAVIIKHSGVFVNPENAPASVFRMAPLCWVEGKPVYKGDVLYGNYCSEYMYIVDFVKEDMIYTQNNKTGSFCEHPMHLTWKKPKKIHKVWFNLYAVNNSNNINASISFDSEQEAIEAQGNYSPKFIKRICVELEK